jgi:hypothetical protein
VSQRISGGLNFQKSRRSEKFIQYLSYYQLPKEVAIIPYICFVILYGCTTCCPARRDARGEGVSESRVLRGCMET